VELERVTEMEVRAEPPRLALLPVGATEGHANHLPYGTDSFIAAELARRVAERYPGAIALPVLPYGMSWAYEDSPLTLSFSPDTLTRAIHDVLDGLIRHGINRILIINGHDGNIASIEAAAREIRRDRGVTVAALEAWWMLLPTLLPENAFSTVAGNGGHAGEPETALALAAVPDLVHVERSHPPRTAPDTRHLYGPGAVALGMVSDHYANWEFLDASQATSSAGEQAMHALVEYLLDFVVEAERAGWRFSVLAQAASGR
jgi:creatinine amidohydrolase